MRAKKIWGFGRAKNCRPKRKILSLSHTVRNFRLQETKQGKEPAPPATYTLYHSLAACSRVAQDAVAFLSLRCLPQNNSVCRPHNVRAVLFVRQCTWRANKLRHRSHQTHAPKPCSPPPVHTHYLIESATIETWLLVSRFFLLRCDKLCRSSFNGVRAKRDRFGFENSHSDWPHTTRTRPHIPRYVPHVHCPPKPTDPTSPCVTVVCARAFIKFPAFHGSSRSQDCGIASSALPHSPRASFVSLARFMNGAKKILVGAFLSLVARTPTWQTFGRVV